MEFEDIIRWFEHKPNPRYTGLPKSPKILRRVFFMENQREQLENNMKTVFGEKLPDICHDILYFLKTEACHEVRWEIAENVNSSIKIYLRNRAQIESAGNLDKKFVERFFIVLKNEKGISQKVKLSGDVTQKLEAFHVTLKNKLEEQIFEAAWSEVYKS
ncbi:MAG: hypothetical protein AAF621_00410 [Pseudomonadota bacterium]